jgi:hypothetical protein
VSESGALLGDELRVTEVEIGSADLDADPESLAVVSAGERFAVTFSDRREGNDEVYVVFVDCE